MGDDRAEFESSKKAMAASMAADEDLFRQALTLASHADRYGYSYQWTWLGLPLIQMPEDVLVLQEIIWANRPQLIIETGVARGGSVIFEASILELIGEGEVFAIDVEIREHNRHAIESHPLASRVRLIEGSSTDPAIVAMARQAAARAERVMVILDSDHTHAHVLGELELYAPMVTEGQCLVVADTLIEDIPMQEHRPRPWGPGNNPRTAVLEYLAAHPEFSLDRDIEDKLLLSSSRGGYLRRRG